MTSISPQTSSSQAIKIVDITGVMCAWGGCRATARGTDLKPGWVNVIVLDREVRDLFKVNLATDPAIKHDIVFCPLHAAELEWLLHSPMRKG